MDDTAICPVCGDTVEWCKRNLAEARAQAQDYEAWWRANVGPDGLVPWERELLGLGETPA